MKAIIAVLFTLLSIDLLAEDSRKYQGYGYVHFERNALACEIQNNIGETGRVHKIAFDMVCRDRRTGQFYNSVKVVRCGIDYQNCDIEGYDFEVFHSGRIRRNCHYIERARCRFTYSFIDEDQGDDPDNL